MTFSRGGKGSVRRGGVKDSVGVGGWRRADVKGSRAPLRGPVNTSVWTRRKWSAVRTFVRFRPRVHTTENQHGSELARPGFSVVNIPTRPRVGSLELSEFGFPRLAGFRALHMEFPGTEASPAPSLARLRP